MPRKKSPPDSALHLTVVIDYRTPMKINELAERYGIEPEEVLRELVEMETSERPEGATVH
jgi:predicted transcriptional regulator